ncbi:hypothetical protein SAMN05444365_10440 [Micromonospora pattaloongensis]|uniref:Uncharacterized protein n=1 Tax=Micromonospora pattaloongensis TaxID=405436 RepID=A0A1H3NKM7_9ACTN|nr:hypothetical protein [Micromonospora pattaloongensis]SDY89486.1 hypothetical protein SAMN05444365_10440 [Micromonospora pattaloongensis]
MTPPPIRPHRAPPRPVGALRRAGVLLAAAVTVVAAAAVPARAAEPGGIYRGMGACPLRSAAMKDPSHLQVGCVISVTNGGSMTIGATTVPLTSPITLTFGVYWPSDAPVVNLPDGSTANVYTVVPPANGRLLTAAPLQVTLPGLPNLIPGVTSVFAQVELAGPITDFVPLATGASYPAFAMPIRLHLRNALFGPSCYIGSSRNPIVLRPTTGTTSPPPPADPVTGDPGTIAVEPDPNGFQAIVASFTGATLVDNALGVPAANGCGLLGALDPVINRVFGLPSGPGHNAVVFRDTDTSLAIDPSLADLAAAIAAASR